MFLRLPGELANLLERTKSLMIEQRGTHCIPLSEWSIVQYFDLLDSKIPKLGF